MHSSAAWITLLRVACARGESDTGARGAGVAGFRRLAMEREHGIHRAGDGVPHGFSGPVWVNGEFDDGTRHRATGQWFVATTGDPPTVVDPSVAVVVYAKRVAGAAKGAHVQAALGGFGSVGQLDVRVEDHELEELGLGVSTLRSSRPA